MSENEAGGTFACPICGFDRPHHHSDEVKAAYQEDQVRDDGWTSVVKLTPKNSGWYLCRGVKVPHGQRDESVHGQLHWFLWCRDGAARDLETRIPEVLYWDCLYQRWSLRNLLGNASQSGAESRWQVSAHPTYWRDIPALGPTERSELPQSVPLSEDK